VPAASYSTCSLQPIAAYRPVDGISPLTERVPDDRQLGITDVAPPISLQLLLQLVAIQVCFKLLVVC